MGNHGTKQTEDSDIDRTPEYAAFMKELAEYHQYRGTHLTREPALGPRKISLLKLYNKIIAYGGYDKVSDTSLMWRRIADEYGVPPMSNAGMPGYLLKSMYYKNLAAFEIERHWGKKAPPPELLEALTARGGAILSRPDIQNPQQQQQQQQQQRPAVQQQLQQTPVAPTKGVRAAAAAAAAAPSTRNMYQQVLPAQMLTVPMAPVTQSAEYFRPPPESEYVRPLYPITAGQFGSNTLHDNETNHLQPLVTRAFIEQHKPVESFEGRITLSSLNRATLSLKSGMASEMDWAVKLLTRASYDLANDFILERVTGLAETLLFMVQTGLATLAAERDGRAPGEPQFPNGEDGDRVIKRVKSTHDHFRHTERGGQAARPLEAALILRNLTMQPENAKYIGRLPVTLDILRQGLSLEEAAHTMELRQYCIELSEAIVPFILITSEEDPLYMTLVELLRSDDRNELLLGLRALSRLSVADEHNRLLQDINSPVVSRLIQYLQLEDEELLHALTAFFFQFTTYQANTASLARNAEAPTLLRRLNGLTMWNAQERTEQLQLTDSRTIVRPETPPPANPPQLSDEIVRELLTFQEPERAIHWMRACFEEDREQSVTQILLWQSYRTLFTPYSQPQQNGSVVVSGKPLLQAADVIKMVGNAFNGATAMVVNHPTEGQKFIVRGIRCRESPLAPSGKRYTTCQWIADAETKAPCAAPFANEKDLHTHVMEKHLKAQEGKPLLCCWQGCSKFAPGGEVDRKVIAVHLRLHTSDAFPKKEGVRTIHGTKISITNEHTQQDEKGEPKGIALTAALTLRNILRANTTILASESLSVSQLKGDLLNHLTLNPVVAQQAGEVLAAMK